MSKTLALNNGLQIPKIGLGTYRSKEEEVVQAVKDAIDAGYRHFDCAWIYENEVEVGRGIKEKISEGVVKRQDLFVTSKLWNNFHEKSEVLPKLKESLKYLQLDYLDLYLIHWPMGFKATAPTAPTSAESYSDVDYLETWEALEECVKLGLTKSIGLSNFNEEQIDRVLSNCKIKPVVNQIEVSPNLTQKRMLQFCKERGIVVVGFSPLGRSSVTGLNSNLPQPTIWEPKVVEMGKKYNKSAAQVVLRYLLTFGIAVIPKSVTKSRIIENINVFDFNLDQEDIDYLASLNIDSRVSRAKDYMDHKYYPFEK